MGIGSILQLKKVAEGLKDAQQKLNAEIQKQNERREEIIGALAAGERIKKMLDEEQDRSAQMADLLRAYQKKMRGINLDSLADIMHFSPGEKAVAQHFKKENPKANAVDVLQKIRNLAAKAALDELTNACIRRDLSRSGDVLSGEDSATFQLLSVYRERAEKEALRKIREEKAFVERQMREKQAQKQVKIDAEKMREAERRAEIERQARVLAAQMEKLGGDFRSFPSSSAGPDFG
ncbi:MAG: hypothetical protein Q4F13_11550 [Pseudomonadota bacterium]|nr:hypothetical protein [Pseudomonadota bacterium]